MNTKDMLSELQKYNEDELFYKNYYEMKQTDNFESFLKSLDMKYINERLLITPDIEGGFMPDSVGDDAFFFDDNDKNNVILSKHNRYTPVFNHQHQFFELVYVLQGSCRQNIQHQHFILKEGDFCLIAPTSIHSIEVFDDSLIINILIRFSTFEEIFYSILKDTNKISTFFTNILYTKTYKDYLIISSYDDLFIREHILTMYIENLEKKKYYESILDSELIILFSKLLQNYENTIRLPNDRKKFSNDFSNMIAYIDKNYQTTTLKAIAQEFHFSTAYCSRIIKNYTGKSFTQLQQAIRFHKACFFLENTNKAISEISELVGFNNVEHFNRLFKKIYQQTPGEYRKHQSRKN
jgi:AraC-like DNA-binding protein/mannose-6-phosphate isomerase-like protein (cupin superfamily)